jgi:CRP-like cAMP-binding protein
VPAVKREDEEEKGLSNRHKGGHADTTVEVQSIIGERAMPLIPESAVQKSFAALPVAEFRAGETVLGAGTRTGRLMILKQGAVAVIKDGVEIANVSHPGAIFGELSILLLVYAGYPLNPLMYIERTGGGKT